jgi:hypothetical protein
MDKFLESMELITGTVKGLEEISNNCFLKNDKNRLLIPNRKEVIKVIKDLQSLLFPNYFKHSEGSENVLSQTELLLNIYSRLASQIEGACQFLIFVFGDTKVGLCPFADLCHPLSLVFSGQKAVKPPVDHHTELRLPKPLSGIHMPASRERLISA